MSTTPTRILFTIPNFITAGSGRAMLNVIERLDRSAFDPTVCVLRRGGAMERELDRLHVPLIDLPFTVPIRPYRTLPRRAWQSANLFRPYGFSLWHSYHYGDDYSEPIIARLSGARAWIYTKKNMNWHRRSWRVRTMLASGIAAQNTDMLRAFFSSGRSRRVARLVPPGVDLDLFSPDTPPRLCLRSKLGIAPDVPVVACVAQLVRVKGHPTLLRAAARIQGVHVWLAGREMDGAYTDELRSIVSEMGIADRVHFLGAVADVPALLAEADVFVLPTDAGGHEEGCPVAVLEAAASSRACIVTNVAGSRDIIVPGESGVQVPAGDSSAMADALRSLVCDAELRHRLGAAARQRAVARFSIDGEVQSLASLYERALRLPNASARRVESSRRANSPAPA